MTAMRTHVSIAQHVADKHKHRFVCLCSSLLSARHCLRAFFSINPNGSGGSGRAIRWPRMFANSRHLEHRPFEVQALDNGIVRGDLYDKSCQSRATHWANHLRGALSRPWWERLTQRAKSLCSFGSHLRNGRRTEKETEGRHGFGLRSTEILSHTFSPPSDRLAKSVIQYIEEPAHTMCIACTVTSNVRSFFVWMNSAYRRE